MFDVSGKNSYCPRQLEYLERYWRKIGNPPKSKSARTKGQGKCALVLVESTANLPGKDQPTMVRMPPKIHHEWVKNGHFFDIPFFKCKKPVVFCGWFTNWLDAFPVLTVDAQLSNRGRMGPEYAA